MQNVKNTMIERLLAFVAPYLCFGCGKMGAALCDRCKKDIVSSAKPVCVLCGMKNPRGICYKHGVSYDRAWLVGERGGLLQLLIGLYKFGRCRSLAEDLAGLLHATLPRLENDYRIVSIPTARSRIRERGYDHMKLLATAFAKRRGIPIEAIFERLDNSTQHQAGRRERFQQVQGAFRLVDTPNPTLTYLIIDDVVTTGATVEHAASLLRRAGATRIEVAVIARQPLD